MLREVKIDAKEPDISESAIRWYGDDEVFIGQTEVGGKSAGILLFSRDAVPDLIAGLQKFLSGEEPMSKIDLNEEDVPEVFRALRDVKP